MSVLFLPPSAGAASVPDASETVKGIIRIATSAEATAGTDDLTSMTPAKVKSVVDAAVAGGVTYKGTFDAAAPLDLSNAVQGDLYIIDGAGTYQGKTWAVGDHLLVNADMGGTVDPAKIDKIDSTDSVTSVAGRTGAVVLSTADISGLATVATSGAYSDLSGTPSLATVATTGAYSDLTGAPDVPVLENNFVTTTSTATAISENGHYAYWLNNNTSSITLTLPVQGAGVVAYLTFATLDSVGHTVTLGSGQFRLSGGVSATSLSIPAGTTRSFYYYGATYWELSSNELNELGDVTITSPSNGEALIYNSTSGDWENGTVSASVAALDDIGDVDTTGVSTNNVLKYDGANWVDGSVAYSEVTGTPTLATVATSGAYSDLTGTPSLATVATTGAYSDLTGTPTLGTAAALDVGTSANNVVQLDGAAKLPAVDGSQLINLPSGASTLGALTDVTITTPANGEALIYNSTSGDWENGTVSATVATLNDIGNVNTTGQAAEDLLKYDGTNWVAAKRFEVVTTVTASTALTVPEMEQLVRTSGSGITLTLPNIASNSIPAGVRYQVKVTDSNSITITPNGTELLEGVNASYATSGAKEALTVLCDGTGWWFV